MPQSAHISEEEAAGLEEEFEVAAEAKAKGLEETEDEFDEKEANEPEDEPKEKTGGVDDVVSALSAAFSSTSPDAWSTSGPEEAASQEEWSTSSGPIPQSGQLPEESDAAAALVPPKSVDAEGVKEKVEVDADFESNENIGAAALDAGSRSRCCALVVELLKEKGGIVLEEVLEDALCSNTLGAEDCEEEKANVGANEGEGFN